MKIRKDQGFTGIQLFKFRLTKSGLSKEMGIFELCKNCLMFCRAKIPDSLVNIIELKEEDETPFFALIFSHGTIATINIRDKEISNKKGSINHITFIIGITDYSEDDMFTIGMLLKEFNTLGFDNVDFEQWYS